MTVAIPCASCGACFTAGHGALCGNCRPEGWHPGELRIPDTRGMQTIPLNDAARKQMVANGEAIDEDATARVRKMLGL